MESLRPGNPNPTGTAAIEPPTLGSQPLYPQFLRPLGAEVLAVNDPSLFFPDGVPGYEPMTNPYTTSPFFPAIPEAQATPPPPNPLPAPPQIPALLDAQFEELEEEIAETILPSNVPILPSNVPNISAVSEELTETSQPQSVSDAGLEVPAQTNELPSERSSTVPPSPSIAPQSILETEESVLLPRSPIPNVAQTPVPAEQPIAPTLIASEQVLEQETALTEDLAETKSRSQPEVLAQNLIEAPEELAEVPEANAQILQVENEERPSEITQQVPLADPPQPNVLSAPPQVDILEVQTPETATASENEQPSIAPNPNRRQFPEGRTQALSRADIPEQTPELTGAEAELLQETPTENQILPPTQEQLPALGQGRPPEFVPEVKAVDDPGSDSEAGAFENLEPIPGVLSTENASLPATLASPENPEALSEVIASGDSGLSKEVVSIEDSGVSRVEPAENLGVVPDIRATEDSELILEAETAETPGSLPEAVSSQNPGVLPQTSEALRTESPEPIPGQSSDHLVNLPESAPQIFTPERLQVDSVQDAEETRAALSPPIPNAIPAETLLTSSEEVSEAVPAQTPEIPAIQDFETLPVENLEASAGQDLEATLGGNPEASAGRDVEATPTETPDTASRQAPEAVSTADPEISSRQIFADRPAETLVGNSLLAPEQSIATSPEVSAPLLRQVNLEDPSEPLSDAVSPESAEVLPEAILEVLPQENPALSSTLTPETAAESLEVPSEVVPQVSTESPESVSPLPLEVPAQSIEVSSEGPPESISTPLETPENALAQRDVSTESTTLPEQTPLSTETTTFPEQLPAVPASEAALPLSETTTARPEPLSETDTARSQQLPEATETLPETDSALPEQLPETTTALSTAETALESAEVLAPQSPEALSSAIPVETTELSTEISSQIPESTSTETIETTPSPQAFTQTQPTVQSVPETETNLPTEPSMQGEREPGEEIALNADLQEQAQTLHAALANRLAQLEADTPQPLASEISSASESSDAPEPEGSAVPESPLPLPSLGDLAAQLDDEGQTALTELIDQADNVTPPSAELLANVTDRLPPDAVPALENLLQSGLLPPVVETQPQTQAPEPTTTASTDPVAESLPETLLRSTVLGDAREETPQTQVPPLPPAILRGNAATSAFQGLQLPILTEAPSAAQETADLEFPGAESPEGRPEEALSASQTPEETSILDPEETQLLDRAEDGQIPVAPGTPEASPGPVDSYIQPVLNVEEQLPDAQNDAEAAPLLPDPGLGISPFLPIALDNLSTLTPLDLKTSPTAATFQDFAPLTFAPQAPVEPDTLFQAAPKQSPSTTQSLFATQRPEENQAVGPREEQTNDLGLQTQELPLPSEAQDFEPPQPAQSPIQTQDFEPFLVPETPFSLGTMVGTSPDQEESAFLGTLFDSAEPLGQAAIESLVQMPEARQLEISNALPLARRPNLPTETPSPQAPTQRLSATAPSPQPEFAGTSLELGEHPIESPLVFEDEHYPQTATPLEFASLPQTFDQTTPASPTAGYVQSTQPLIYRPTPTVPPDSSLADATKSTIDQSGIEELLNLGTDNHYQESEPPSFEDAPTDEESETPLGQIFRQGMEQGQSYRRESGIPEEEEASSSTYTMEAPEQEDDDDDDDIDSGGSGINIESLARQIYYMVRHRIDREKERHGGHQDRGGW